MSFNNLDPRQAGVHVPLTTREAAIHVIKVKLRLSTSTWWPFPHIQSGIFGKVCHGGSWSQRETCFQMTLRSLCKVKQCRGVVLLFHKQHCRHSCDVKMTQAVNHTQNTLSVLGSKWFSMGYMGNTTSTYYWPLPKDVLPGIAASGTWSPFPLDLWCFYMAPERLRRTPLLCPRTSCPAYQSYGQYEFLQEIRLRVTIQYK